jgi:hypothetical protein
MRPTLWYRGRIRAEKGDGSCNHARDGGDALAGEPETLPTPELFDRILGLTEGRIDLVALKNAHMSSDDLDEDLRDKEHRENIGHLRSAVGAPREALKS